MPNVGIHGWDSTNWKGSADVASNCSAISTVRTSVATENTRATCFARRPRPFGSRATTMLPTSGTTISVVSQG